MRGGWDGEGRDEGRVEMRESDEGRVEMRGG